MKIKERITEINDRGVQKFLIYKTDKDGNPVRCGILTWDGLLKRGVEKLKQMKNPASSPGKGEKRDENQTSKKVRFLFSLSDCQTGSNDEEDS